MNTTMVVLRLIHILFGVLWAGGSYIMTGFISVSAKARVFPLTLTNLSICEMALPLYKLFNTSVGSR